MSLTSIANGESFSPDSDSIGSLFTPYSRTVQFQFGVPTPLDVEFTATASARLGEANEAGAASFDFSPTVYWDGIIAVDMPDIHGNNQPVNGVQLTSDSGTNWLLADPPAAAPEPDTAAMLAAGILILTRRKR